jgi:putative endonuclease
MAIFSRIIFEAVKRRARQGLNADADSLSDMKQDAWQHLRRHGYVFVARNHVPRDVNGEIDLIGYDGKTLVFVKVRTRTAREDQSALSGVSARRRNGIWSAARCGGFLWRGT